MKPKVLRVTIRVNDGKNSKCWFLIVEFSQRNPGVGATLYKLMKTNDDI